MLSLKFSQFLRLGGHIWPGLGNWIIELSNFCKKKFIPPHRVSRFSPVAQIEGNSGESPQVVLIFRLVRRTMMWNWHPTNHVSMEWECSDCIWDWKLTSVSFFIFLIWNEGLEQMIPRFSSSSISLSWWTIWDDGYDLWLENSHLLMTYLTPHFLLLTSCQDGLHQFLGTDKPKLRQNHSF